MSTAATQLNSNDQSWSERARYFNSGNAFALKLSSVPSATFVDERDRAFDPDTPTGLIDMDLREALNTPFAATTPLVLSRYLRVRAGESFTVDVKASAQLLCILKGKGHTELNGERREFQSGDVLALPGAAKATHVAHASEDLVIWLVTDEPALAFMNLEPASIADSMVPPVYYPAAELARELEAVYAHPDCETFPGYAVVLSHDQLEHTRNIHPTMTLALNSLPAGQSQRPHIHNSMALTLCVQGEGCYSTVDGQRKDWSQHAVMVTPPCSPHSHHNDGDKRMECLIVQDGGLHYYARTIGFSFAD